MRKDDLKSFHAAARKGKSRATWKPLKEALEQLAVCVHADAQSDVLSDHVAQIMNDDGDDHDV